MGTMERQQRQSRSAMDWKHSRFRHHPKAASTSAKWRRRKRKRWTPKVRQKSGRPSFPFVSVPVDGPFVASTSGSKLQPQFVIPALPPHLLNSSTPALDPASSNSTSSHQPQAKRSRTTPKNPFPDAHLPFLKEKVASMGTTSLIALVETLYLDLKTHGVKKNAIEAKIREICVKGQRHIWSLKANTEVSILFVVNDHS